jgi:hypothetical protein
VLPALRKACHRLLRLKPEEKLNFDADCVLLCVMEEKLGEAPMPVFYYQVRERDGQPIVSLPGTNPLPRQFWCLKGGAPIYLASVCTALLVDATQPLHPAGLSLQYFTLHHITMHAPLNHE